MTQTLQSNQVQVGPIVQVVIGRETKAIAFSELATQGQDPAVVSDADLITMVANFLDRQLGDFAQHTVTRPATGNILISPIASFG